MQLPTTTPKQRSKLYTDVEDMIQVGFLSHPITVGRTQLCFRSLLPGDLHLLKWRAVKEEAWRKWIVASAIWLVDGMCLLEEAHAAPKLARVLQNLPNTAMEILFSITLGLFNRAAKSMSLIEAYCYEDHSRNLWKSIGREVPTSHAGIPGTERLGLNAVQGMWVMFNQAEDDRAAMEVQWEGAKLIASAMSPKGVQKLDARDKQQRADEQARRQRVLDMAYYVSKGLATEDGLVAGGSQTSIHGAHSVEELEDEMRRWVAGEEDWHDKIVSGYKQWVTEGLERRKREHQARLEALRQEAERREAEGVGPVPLVAYTPDQLNAILADRRKGRPPGMRRVYPDGDKRQQLYERYLAHKEGPPQPMVATPDGGLSPLAAEVANRQVPYQTRKEG